jgi:hypothetical protein
MTTLYDTLSALTMSEIAALFGACYTVVSIAAIPLRRPLVGVDETDHHEALDAIFSAVSSLYAILLGLILVAAWQNFQSAEAEQIAEANHIVTLFRLTGGLSEPAAGKIRSGLYGFTQTTVDEEWDAMDALFKASQGQATGLPKAFAYYNDVWSEYLRYEPKGNREAIVLTDSMQALIRFGEARRSRLLDAKPYLPADVWRLLFGGALLVMFMAALFTVGRSGLFAVTSFGLGVSIAIELAVVLSVDHPYAGRTVVEPNALKNAVHVMEQLGVPLTPTHLQPGTLSFELPPKKQTAFEPVDMRRDAGAAISLSRR